MTKPRFPWALGAFLLAAFAVAASGTLADAPAPSAKDAAAARASARALGEAFSDVARRASPTVVSIRVETKVAQQGLPPGFEQFFGIGPGAPGIQRGGGSGVILRADGHILTNNHVVQNAERIEVRLHDGQIFRADVVGTDPASDLAVIRIPAKQLTPAKFANIDEARIGEWVVAIGSPFGLDYSVTTGVLSATGRGSMGASEVGDYLQTDASINPGNSGGPLVNLDAEVLGINTFIIGRGMGMGFAIPADIARNVADQLIDRGTVRRAWIGVTFQEVTPELASYFGAARGQGALVSSVLPESPAAKAGIEAGDVITAVGARKLADAKDLQREVMRVPVGSRLKLALLRNGQPRSLELVTGERPGDLRAEARGQRGRGGRALPKGGASVLGLHLEALTPMARQALGYRGVDGVAVAGVEPGSAADRAGLSRGDVIVAADRAPVRKPEDVMKALSDGRALLRVARGGAEQFVVLSKS